MSPNSTDRHSSLLEDEEQQKESGGTASQLQAKRKRQLDSDNSIPLAAAVSTLSSSRSSSSSSGGNYDCLGTPRHAKRACIPNAKNTTNDGETPAAPAPANADQSSTSAHGSSLIGPATRPFVSASGFVRRRFDPARPDQPTWCDRRRPCAATRR